MNPTEPVDPIERKAADWVMKHRQGRLGPAEQAAYRRWLEADPRHAAIAQRLDRAWQVSAALRQGYVRPARPARAAGPLGWLQAAWQRPWASGGALSGLAMACWLWLAPPFWLQGLGADYQTGYGEVRHVTLNDGSQVELGSRSILSIAYDGQRRTVRLKRGEAVFSPSPVGEAEPRPFTVSTPGATVTARGTRYLVAVDQDERSGWVGVLQHSVEINLVSHGLNDVSASAVLQEGDSLYFGPHAGLRPLEQSPEELASWQEGRVVLRQKTLAQAAEQLGRYRAGLTVVRGEALRRLPVSAVARIDHVDDALRQLASQAHARVLELPGVLLIY
ncbi:FecR family protein [Pseudomonas putida]|uniref:FecR family protein n=1 Tax=Pseudomonas putida TaxID=303 RepID=UPI0024E17315|nr:FecR domain-containing protein [Pseudomonas putida]